MFLVWSNFKASTSSPFLFPFYLLHKIKLFVTVFLTLRTLVSNSTTSSTTLFTNYDITGGKSGNSFRKMFVFYHRFYDNCRIVITTHPTRERDGNAERHIFSTMQRLFVLSSNPDKGTFEITKGERTFNELPGTFAKYHEAKKQSVQRGREREKERERGKKKIWKANAKYRMRKMNGAASVHVRI